MANNHVNPLLIAAGMGAIAGMRSAVGPAVLSHQLSRRKPRGWRIWHKQSRLERVLSSPAAARALKLLAGGEMIIDKTPGLPARIAVPGLAGRAVMGALSAAVIAGRAKQPRLRYALVGSAAAVASAYVLYFLRTRATRRLSVPDGVAGLVEDAVAARLGARLASAVL